MSDDRWNTAMDHLKYAFKDETVVSNAAMTILSQHENESEIDQDEIKEVLLKYEKLQAQAEALANAKSDLINVDDEISFHSLQPTNEDRYHVQGCEAEFTRDIPGVMDVSSVQSDNPGVLNISLSRDDEDMHILFNDQGNRQKLFEDHEFFREDDLSDSVGTGSTTDGGSLLFNVFNEDYEGRPDPQVMKTLVEAKHLPRNLDPFVLTQIRRVRIIHQLRNLEEDDSDDGDCNFMLNRFCLPKACAAAEEDTDDENSLVDTIIDCTDNDDNNTLNSNASLDIADLVHKRPKRSKYMITGDKEYKPGKAPEDLVLMLPRNDESFTDDEDESVKSEEIEKGGKKLPVQYAVNDKDSDSEHKTIRKTYEEKEMEFTLQNYDMTPHRIAQRVMKGEGDASPEEYARKPESLMSQLSGPLAPDEVEILAFRGKRYSDDDDPIEEDRSVLSPEEIEAFQKEFSERLEKANEEAIENENMHIDEEAIENENKPIERGPLSHLMDIFNNKQSCAVNLINTKCSANITKKIDTNRTILSLKTVVEADSTDSCVLNPADENLRSSQEENVFPNTPRVNNMLFSDVSDAGNDEKDSRMSKRVLQSLMSEDTNETVSEKALTPEMSQCCMTTRPDDDQSLEDLLNILEVTVNTNPTESIDCDSQCAVEAEEIVMGEAVQGIHFSSPDPKYGMIIYPKQMEKLQQKQTECGKSTSDDSNILEKYADILHPANCIDSDSQNSESTVQHMESTNKEKKPNSVCTGFSDNEVELSIDMDADSTYIHTNNADEKETEEKATNDSVDFLLDARNDSLCSGIVSEFKQDSTDFIVTAMESEIHISVPQLRNEVTVAGLNQVLPDDNELVAKIGQTSEIVKSQKDDCRDLGKEDCNRNSNAELMLSAIEIKQESNGKFADTSALKAVTLLDDVDVVGKQVSNLFLVKDCKTNSETIIDPNNVSNSKASVNVSECERDSKGHILADFNTKDQVPVSKASDVGRDNEQNQTSFNNVDGEDSVQSYLLRLLDEDIDFEQKQASSNDSEFIAKDVQSSQTKELKGDIAEPITNQSASPSICLQKKEEVKKTDSSAQSPSRLRKEKLSKDSKVLRASPGRKTSKIQSPKLSTRSPARSLEGKRTIDTRSISEFELSTPSPPGRKTGQSQKTKTSARSPARSLKGKRKECNENPNKVQKPDTSPSVKEELNRLKKSMQNNTSRLKQTKIL